MVEQPVTGRRIAGRTSRRPVPVTFAPGGGLAGQIPLEISQRYGDETQALAFDSLVSALGVLGGEPLLREPSPIYGTAADPEGAWIAAGRMDGSISVCPLKDGPHVKPRTLTAAHGRQRVQALVASGGRLYSAGWDGFVRGWRIGADLNAELALEIPCKPNSLAISPDGQWLIARIANNQLGIWDLSESDAKEVRGLILGKSNKTFESLAISPDNRWLAAGGDDKVVRLWDRSDPDPVSTQERLYGHTKTISVLRFTSDSQTLISGSDDKSARVWRIDQSGNCHPVAVLQGHEATVRCIEAVAELRCVVTGSVDGTLRRWNLAPHNLPGTYPDRPVRSRPGYEPYSAIRVAYSHDGKWVASADLAGGIRLWPVSGTASEPEVLRGHTKGVYALAFDPRGRYLVSGSFDGTVRRWELTTANKPGRAIIGLDEGRKADSIAVAPKGDYIFVGDLWGTISMWHQQSTKVTLVDAIRVQRGPRRFVVHPDGSSIYGVNLDGQLTQWRVTTDSLEPVRVFGKLDQAVSAMAMNGQGSVLAAGSASGSVHVYDISEGKMAEFKVLAGDSQVESLVFSPDGAWLYAGADRGLRGWRLDQPHGLPTIVMRGHHFESIDISGDGTRLVSGGHGEEVPCFWWLRPDELLQVARRKAGRELTDEEVQRFNVAGSEKLCDEPRG